MLNDLEVQSRASLKLGMDTFGRKNKGFGVAADWSKELGPFPPLAP